MLDGLMPIAGGLLIIAIVLSAAKQLFKNFKVARFIPFILCRAFMVYVVKDLTVLESLGKSVWKISSNLITHVNVPRKEE